MKLLYYKKTPVENWSVMKFVLMLRIYVNWGCECEEKEQVWNGDHLLT